MVSVTRAVFGDLPSGAGTVEKFQLQSDLLKVDIISWGCTITALEAKDRQGRASDVVLGFAELEGGLNSAWAAGPQPCRSPPLGRAAARDPGGSPELVAELVAVRVPAAGRLSVFPSIAREKTNEWEQL